MKFFTRTFLQFLLLLVIATPVNAAQSLQDAWLGLIKAELPAKCGVSIIKVGIVVSGNNGTRDEQWFVRTCKGNREYWVYYYPPSAFPDRHSPYAIVRVTSKT